MTWGDVDTAIGGAQAVIMKNAAKLRKLARSGSFQFKPFSPHQKKVLSWWCEESPYKNRNGIIADGSLRSGKTLCMSLSFCLWTMTRFNGQSFALCGKTIGSLRRNVLFWLKIMLRGRGYSVEEHRTDNLFLLRRGDIANYFYLFGGKDERSQNLIQGITLAGVLFDEVALMPESFVNQATARCSVAGSKWWFSGSGHSIHRRMRRFYGERAVARPRQIAPVHGILPFAYLQIIHMRFINRTQLLPIIRITEARKPQSKLLYMIPPHTKRDTP